MIGLDGKLQDFPSFLCTLDANLMLTLPSDPSREDRFAWLGTPEQVIDDQVNTVLVALIVHVDGIYSIDIEINRSVVLAKAENRLTTAFEKAWLAAG
jgi:hypothetical protein